MPMKTTRTERNDPPLRGVIVEGTVTVPVVYFLEQKAYGRFEDASQAGVVVSVMVKGRHGDKAVFRPKKVTWCVGEKELRTEEVTQ